ncbi:putative oxidoreductase [Mycolicibacterium conceptionense]|uniref:Putative oxidoreductase n=1 Tax=Mycolicibacterium conceptionense TaxID=451644 RepID=A0A0U1DM76_9MYCO|nr:putative oxidoreductase [Mycolicibacterium conceptionense]
MSKVVQFDEYGGIDVLQVRDVPRPAPAAGEVLVKVRAAGINPGEAMIRRGALHDRFPATFPSGQGSDLAGVVAELGSGVAQFQVGDEVLGFTDSRASHAEYVAVPATQLARKPAGLSWEVAGSLLCRGRHRLCGRARGAARCKLARRAGATVLGIAGPGNDDWLTGFGVIPVNYGDGLATRLRAASPSGRVDAFLDFFGGGYVKLAVEDLGVAAERVDTIIDFGAIEQYGVQSAGNAEGADIAVIAELADLAATGELEVPIAGVFALDDVQAAYTELEKRHTRGKLVLVP